MNDPLVRLRDGVRRRGARIVLPESGDPRIRSAAAACEEQELCEPVWLESASTAALAAAREHLAARLEARGHDGAEIERRLADRLHLRKLCVKIKIINHLKWHILSVKLGAT